MTRLQSATRRAAFFAPWLACLILCLLQPAAALAEEAAGEKGETWYAWPENWQVQGWNVRTSLYTKHFNPKDYHVNNQKLIGVEAAFDRNWVIGGAMFDNSFGQDSEFVYIGKSWYLWGSSYWYGKVMVGLLHGYEEPYEDKIPFNGLGIAPALIPALGFRYKWFMIEANLGGASTLTVTAGVGF
jgi:hypothetical protein